MKKLIFHAGTDLEKMKSTMKEVYESGCIGFDYTISLIQTKDQLDEFLYECYAIDRSINLYEHQNISMMYNDFLEHLNNKHMIYLGIYK